MGGVRSRYGPLSPTHPSRTCVQVRVDPVGPCAAGRPRRGGPQAVVSESHSSGESGDAGKALVAPPHGRRGARALRQVCTASPSRPVRRVTVAGLVTARSAGQRP